MNFSQQIEYLMLIAKGAAVVILLLWAFLSFGPLYDLFYDENGTPIWLNILFLTGSAPAVFCGYWIIRFVSAEDARPLVDGWVKTKLALLTLYAAAWMFLYQFIA